VEETEALMYMTIMSFGSNEGIALLDFVHNKEA